MTHSVPPAHVKERPILFSAPMVLALLDGSKTQTRRPYKVRKHPDAGCEMAASELVREPQHVIDRICPYGRPGDRLWVRETWAQPTSQDPGPTVYRADYPACAPPGYENVPAIDEITWKPSIHMFRRDSRILLEIVAVCVERLNDCSAEDALAEGVRPDEIRSFNVFGMTATERAEFRRGAAVAPYERLWESINGTGSWAVNPWVWVVEFKQVSCATQQEISQ